MSCKSHRLLVHEKNSIRIHYIWCVLQVTHVLKNHVIILELLTAWHIYWDHSSFSTSNRVLITLFRYLMRKILNNFIGLAQILGLFGLLHRIRFKLGLHILKIVVLILMKNIRARHFYIIKVWVSDIEALLWSWNLFQYWLLLILESNAL